MGEVQKSWFTRGFESFIGDDAYYTRKLLRSAKERAEQTNPNTYKENGTFSEKAGYYFKTFAFNAKNAFIDRSEMALATGALVGASASYVTRGVGHLVSFNSDLQTLEAFKGFFKDECRAIGALIAAVIQAVSTVFSMIPFFGAIAIRNAGNLNEAKFDAQYDAKNAVQKSVREIETQVAAAKADAEKQIKEAKEVADKAIQEAKDEAAKKIKEANEEADKKIKEANDAKDKAVKDAEDATKAKDEALDAKNKAEEEQGKLKAQLDGALKGDVVPKAQLEQEVKAANDDRDAKVKAAEDDRDAKVKEANDARDKAVKDAKEAKKLFDAEIAQLKADLAKAQGEDKDAAVKAVKDPLDAEIVQLKAELAKAQGEDKDEAVKAAKGALEAEVAQLKAELAKAQGEEKDEAVKAVKEPLEAEVAQLKAVEEKLNAIKNAYAALQAILSDDTRTDEDKKADKDAAQRALITAINA